ncbi:MAG TPA: MBL fold metallo-hydrolase [Myxococcaceae bacterium]|nr:MBL fold metallo-hydrolase [Myxococcaceae bacterium]
MPGPKSPPRRTDQIAPGVHVIQHQDALPDFPEGNTTVVVGKQSVLVVDTGYLPSTASRDIEEIRRWTDKPVRTLVLTHGHTDHTSGTGVYARAFPGLRVVAIARRASSWPATLPTTRTSSPGGPPS